MPIFYNRQNENAPWMLEIGDDFWYAVVLPLYIYDQDC